MAVLFPRCGRLLLPLLLGTLLAFPLAERSARAQDGSRGMPAGFSEALQPQFVRRDLPRITETLMLREDQRAVLEALFDDYETAFAEGVHAIRRGIADARPPRDPDSPEQKRRTELRDEMRRLREETRREAERTSDPEERRALMEAYREAVREIQEEIRDLDTGEEPGAIYGEMMNRMRGLVAAWAIDRERLAEEFTLNLRALLDEEQQARWPRLEQRMRREKSLPHGVLSGESIDLIRTVHDQDLDPAEREALTEILEAYAVRLDTALAARNEAARAGREEQFEALQQQDEQRLRGFLERELSLRIAVRDVNEEFAAAIVAALPEAAGARVRQAADLRAFSRIYQPTRAQRVLRSAGKIRALDAETAASVGELQAAYLAELAVHNQQLRTITLAHEPERQRRRMLRMAEAAGAGDEAPRDDPIRAAFAVRRELDEAYLAQLRDLLGDERYEAIPGAVRTAGVGTDGEQRRKLMATFDTDGDGRLSRAEAEALRDHLREQAGGGGGSR